MPRLARSANVDETPAARARVRTTEPTASRSARLPDPVRPPVQAKARRTRRLPASQAAPTPPADVPPVPAGLVWVSDQSPGIRRVMRGDQAVYLDPRGRRIRDEATLARIRKLAVPPAYEAVWICAQANGHLQATGRDARGRKQYRYHAQWQQRRGEDKFAAMRRFGEVLPRIRARVQRDLAPGAARAGQAAARPTRTLVLATLVRLLDTTFIRIGNEAYARGNGSYGLTTLRTRHAGVHAAQVRLSFKGKSGIRHELRLDDRRVAAVVRRCKALPGQELFQYVSEDGTLHKISSADVNDYLCEIAGTHVTAKDFRTWHGSVLALAFTCAACAGEPVHGAATQVIAEVARRLGNTVAVCRKSYVHPRVLELGLALADERLRAGLLQQGWATAKAARSRNLSVDEKRLLALLALPAPAGTAPAPAPGRAGRKTLAATRAARSAICQSLG